MNIAVILAGGSGTRMGIIDKPKQFIEVYGKPILAYTLETFDNNKDIDEIVVVSIKEWIDDVRIILRKFEINKVKWIIEGGNTRQESVFNAIKHLESVCLEDDNIIIHDSVRPLISNKIITNNIFGVNKFSAVDTVIPSADTVIICKDGQKINNIPQRKDMYIGQTPQTFRFSLLYKAHKKALENGINNATDDCQLVLNLGEDVFLVEGDKLNFKITTFEDLLLFKAIIKLGKSEMI